MLKVASIMSVLGVGVGASTLRGVDNSADSVTTTNRADLAHILRDANGNKIMCGCPELNAREGKEIDTHVTARMAQLSKSPSYKATAGGSINVYFHVLRKNGDPITATDQMIDAQMTVLNNAFSTGGWSFVKASVDHYENSVWADLEGDDEPAKRALRKGISTFIWLTYQLFSATRIILGCTPRLIGGRMVW